MAQNLDEHAHDIEEWCDSDVMNESDEDEDDLLARGAVDDADWEIARGGA